MANDIGYFRLLDFEVHVKGVHMPSVNGSYTGVKLYHVMQQSIISHLTLKQLCHAFCYPIQKV